MSLIEVAALSLDGDFEDEAGFVEIVVHIEARLSAELNETMGLLLSPLFMKIARGGAKRCVSLCLRAAERDVPLVFLILFTAQVHSDGMRSDSSSDSWILSGASSSPQNPAKPSLPPC